VELEVVVGDIVRADTDAIVNAANSELWMGAGVAGAIRRAGGPTIEREAMAQGPINPGEAVITAAGDLPLPIRWVIHAATMGPNLETSADYIRSATANSLALAAHAGATSISFPLLGTGVGGFPAARAAEIMVEEARRSPAQLERVVFIVRDAFAADAFEEALRDEP
jgi:O-acetyl-ADP-ribose deacetylase